MTQPFQKTSTISYDTAINERGLLSKWIRSKNILPKKDLPFYSSRRGTNAKGQPHKPPVTPLTLAKVFGRCGGGLEGAGEAFLQKSSPAPSKSFSISLPIPNYSCTTQGRPRRLSCSMNGSGSSCSMFQTPGCIHLPVTIIMAPIMAGTPVV